jgi:hypothetical protein
MGGLLITPTGKAHTHRQLFRWERAHSLPSARTSELFDGKKVPADRVTETCSGHLDADIRC